MKNLVLIFLSVCTISLFTNSASAQTEYGITAGLNFTNIDYSSGINLDDPFFEEIGEETSILFQDRSDFKIGFNIGAYALMDWGVFSFNPAIQFSQAGSKGDSHNLNLGYINVPLMLGVQPFDLLHFQFGPTLGYMVSAKVDPKSGDKYSVYDSDYYNKVDFGAALGLLIDWNGFASVYARYNHGLGSLNEPVNIGSEEYKQQNRVVQVGINVPLGRTTDLD